MQRRNFLKLAGLGAIALSLPRLGKSTAPLFQGLENQRPNILFILADDLGWMDLRCQGSTLYETPNIDRLAARGLRLTQAYAANPFCSPTRASILTGLYPARIGITVPVCHLPEVKLEKKLQERGGPTQQVLLSGSLTRLKPDYVTLAEALHEAGYVTAHFGKWHLGFNRPHHPEDHYEPKDRGFDFEFPHAPNVPSPVGSYFAPWKFIKTPPLDMQADEHIEDRMSTEAAQFIREHKDKTFYMNYWAYSVHAPWNAKLDYIEHFKAKADAKNPQHNPLYAAMVKSLDEGVGRLLAAVDESGLAERTIIVFFSDNGGYAYLPKKTDPAGFENIPATSNLPLRSGKGSIYEGGTREPCIIHWPGKTKANTTSAILFQSVDFYPTLLAMCGLAPRAGLQLDGVNQVPALLGKGAVRECVFCHFPHGQTQEADKLNGAIPATYVRRGDWKLIRCYGDGDDGGDRFELYNLKDDIGETKNIAAEKPALVRELNDLISGFLKDTAAVVPRRNPAYDPQAQSAPKRKQAPKQKTPEEKASLRRQRDAEGEPDVIS
ncbi:MAG: N-acetylgalactosamine 6-sulfate sulfatase [Verrucomicrobia bacterium]|nr:MAG: N-acetylgalactosamine 6-sulfate sulfatase [Verrucomicrobiota bacterium]